MKLAKLWSRPLDSFSFFKADGVLDEESWQQMKATNPVEVP